MLSWLIYAIALVEARRVTTYRRRQTSLRPFELPLLFAAQGLAFPKKA
jgi:hypothetical protein